MDDSKPEHATPPRASSSDLNVPFGGVPPKLPAGWVNTKQLRVLDPAVAVEQLVFEVRAAAFDEWEKAEFEYWTKAEGDRFPALLHKEIWLQDLGEWYRVSVVIYWSTLQEWLAVDPDWLEAQEAAFVERVGADNLRRISAGHDTGAHYFKISEYR